jgi:hypothetical protein
VVRRPQIVAVPVVGARPVVWARVERGRTIGVIIGARMIRRRSSQPAITPILEAVLQMRILRLATVPRVVVT